MKKILYSKIKDIFSVDLMIELNAITYADATNKEKGDMIIDILRSHNINSLPLGSGTNRIGLQIGDSVFKIALDHHGKIDNKREFKYTDKLQPYVIKVYECLTDGLITSCEPYIPISLSEMEDEKDEILAILRDISKNFFIGDIGFNKDNYKNWGRRKTDKKIGILDFAYIYSVSYQTFRCTCEAKSFLKYDKNYVDLICPSCGERFPFGIIRRRISKKDEAEEIGNLEESSYVLHGPTEIVEENKNYTISLYDDPNEKDTIDRKHLLKMKNKEINRRLDGKIKFNERELDSPDTFEDLVKSLDKKIQEKERIESK